MKKIYFEGNFAGNFDGTLKGHVKTAEAAAAGLPCLSKGDTLIVNDAMADQPRSAAKASGWTWEDIAKAAMRPF